MPSNSDRSRQPLSCPDLPTEVWDKLQQVLGRFEDAWRRGERPNLEDYLHEGGAQRQVFLLELVHEDLEYRFGAGEIVRVETYLEHYPELRHDPDAALSLIAAEYGLRRRREADCTPEEYRQRFPQYGAELAKRLPTGGSQHATSSAALDAGAGEVTPVRESAQQTVPEPPRGPALASAAPESSTDWPALSGYEILGELAQGGMGIVYKSRHRALQRLVALKLLRADYLGLAELERRFREEAQVTGQLQHPGIPPVHEVGALPDGRPFFAMKLIQGRTLADLLGERSAPADDLPRLLGIFEHVCQAVAYAHSKGVIHRDLKPANVMVGAFGEVQVMDWGLAKLLRREQDSGGKMPEATAAPSTLLPPPSPSEATVAGTVLGTPAYMAPEQARGEVGGLDERCDVFGLGAILCQVLTGGPPYAGPDAATVLRKAREAELTDAAGRLKGCGAGAELVRLAGDCLAPDPDLRPRHAGAVAEGVTAYLAGVQERLRAAELERTAAQARAAEETRRRRLALALAEALLALVAGGGAAGWWYWHGQAEQARQQAARDLRRSQAEHDLRAALTQAAEHRHELHRRLADSLRASELLSNIEEWRGLVNGARAAVRRAEVLAESHPDVLPAELLGQVRAAVEQVKRDDQDWRVAKRLDDIRLEAASPHKGKPNPGTAGPKYQAMFDELGLAVAAGESARVADQIRQSPLRYALVAALDLWVVVTPAAEPKPGLVAVARLADPDPWRDQVRDPRNWPNKTRLQRLAKQADLAEQPTQVVILLAHKLGRVGGEVAPLLRRALLHHPTDFWLHLALSHLAQDPVEKMGCYQAALALRPKAAPVHSDWGATLAAQRDYAGAITHYQKALQIDPGLVEARYNWGNALYAQRDYAGAIAHYQKALQIDPGYANAHAAWGHGLHAQGDYTGAIAHYQKALQIDPRCTSAHTNWGLILATQHNYAGAIFHYRQALQIDPRLAEAHYNWGNALYAQGDFSRAVDHYQKALQIDPRYAKAHTAWGGALYARRDYAGAIDQCQKALKLDPQLAEAHSNWGVALHAQQDYAGAVAQYQNALKIDPKHANAHHNWGLALAAQHDYAGAIAHYRQALQIDPRLVEAHSNWGLALATQRDHARAIGHFQQVLRLHPRHARAHLGLGSALLEEGQFTAAEKALLRGKALLPSRHPLHGPAEEQLRLCAKCLLLDRRASAILNGQAQPRDAAEQLTLAVLCGRYKKQYAAAAHFFKGALAGDPKLTAGSRYPAACAAALAAAGQGRDAAALKEDDKPQLRHLALDWLRADLAALVQKFQTEPQAGPVIGKTLEGWQQNPDLSGVRDKDGLAKLAKPERQQWQQLWADVAALVKRAKQL